MSSGMIIEYCERYRRCRDARWAQRQQERRSEVQNLGAPRGEKELGDYLSPAEIAKRLDAETDADRADRLLSNPIRSALRGAVRDIGWEAFARGGIEEMHRIAKAVEEKSGDSFAAFTMDAWWDGIGNETGRWIA